MREDNLYEAMSDLFGITEVWQRGRPPSLGRTAVNGFIVSTLNSYDQGHETAVLNNGDRQTYIIERYDSEEEALEGHNKWVKYFETNNKVMEIDYDEEVTLVPMSSEDIERIMKN